MKNIDAKGKNCPIPVIMAKKAIEAGETQFSVEVDNEIAVQNLTKLAENKHFNIRKTQNGANFTVFFVNDGDVVHELSENQNMTADWAIFAVHDTVGDGDAELGKTLMEMYFYTISQSGNLPRCVLMMNGAVKLAVENEQVISHLKLLSEMGTEVLVCGACLNFYHLQDSLKVGSISNMYEITERMAQVSKVVTI